MGRYYLSSTYKKFVIESSRLSAEFNTAVRLITNSTGCAWLQRLSAEMAIIRLYDSWARFCRELVILSASGKAVTNQGVRLSNAPGITAIPDVIPKLFSTYKKRRFEPRWADPSEAIDAAQRLNIQNFTTISAAIGATNSPAEEIRHVRNFFAHRGLSTADKVRSHFNQPRLRLEIESTAGLLVHPGILRFDKWINRFRVIAVSSIQ